MDWKGWEARDKLLTLARANGFDSVTAPMLARWHRRGLLPRPRTRSLGKGAGTRTLYPPGTGRQLLALCRIHAHTHRLNEVGWQLWWEGFPIPVGEVRKFIKRVAAKLDTQTSFLSNPSVVQDLIDSAATDRMNSPVIRQVRKRLGASRFPAFMAVLGEVGSGRFETFATKDDQRTVEKGLGLERARTDQLPGMPPWLEAGDVGTIIISQVLRTGSFSDALSSIADDDIQGARDELQPILNMYKQVGTVLTRSVARHAFGFTALGEALESLGPAEEAGLFLLFVRLRPKVGDQSIREQLGTVETWDENYKAWYLLEELKSTVPAFEKVLSPRRLSTALRTRGGMATLLGRIRDTRIRHQGEVNAFLQGHPEVEALFNTADH